jgi:hypothetical protein
LKRSARESRSAILERAHTVCLHFFFEMTFAACRIAALSCPHLRPPALSTPTFTLRTLTWDGRGRPATGIAPHPQSAPPRRAFRIEPNARIMRSGIL